MRAIGLIGLLSACGRVGFDATNVEPGAGGIVGDLDSGFGTGGIAVGGSSTLPERLFAIAQEGDGAWRVAGTQYRGGGMAKFVVGRFLAVGELDTAWATLGWSIIGLGAYDYGYGLVTSSGQLFVVGDGAFGGGDDYLITALLPSGSPDPRFGSAGWLRIDLVGEDTAKRGAVLADGSIVLCGTADYPASRRFALARIDTLGAPVASFGTGGRFIADATSILDDCNAVVVDADDRIVTGAGTGMGAAVVRLDRQGALDPTFGAGGVASIPGAGTTRAIAVAPGGDIVAATELGAAIAVARFGSDGRPSESFGVGGVAQHAWEDAVRAREIVVSHDGTIFVGGTTESTSSDVVIAAFTATGTLDGRFGQDGVLRIDLAGRADVLGAMALDGEGGLVAAGWTTAPGGIDQPFLLRLD